MKPRSTALSAAAVLTLSALAGAASGEKPKPPAVNLVIPAPPYSTPSPGSFQGRLLATHNAERKRMRISPLMWSPQLEAQAAIWASHLANKGLFEHSKNRGDAGENLWMGTSGHFTPEQMIGAFIDERRYFRPGKFPDVSTTGKWADVGHYTQLIWRGTVQVGCARATGKGNDVLVCRYYPAGNVIGERVP